ncbi:hypothetical protein [Pseudoalteromonas luteoviolacea]|nr:hypothetical protein [Pseudoalteromonas luteoviolacea]MBQ4906108.1 hypothetical protein [Pseudoalteromonas luteoviolacea]
MMNHKVLILSAALTSTLSFASYSSAASEAKTEQVSASHSVRVCHYKLTLRGPGSDRFPSWETKEVLANKSCPSGWTVGFYWSRVPAGYYAYQYSTYR